MEQKQRKGNNHVILFADDNPSSATITLAVLKHSGYNVIAATNGRQALELFTKNNANISIFIANINMPVMDGKAAYELMREIKPSLPVIFINNGSPDTTTTAYLTKVGAVLLVKPYTIKRLLAHLRCMIELPKTKLEATQSASTNSFSLNQNFQQEQLTPR